MAHTPGPWFEGKPYENELSKPDAVTVGPFEADCHYEDTICEVFGEEHDAVANACLIAASPDLLEALQSILKDAEFGNLTCQLDSNIIQRARAAIAKATGEKPHD